MKVITYELIKELYTKYDGTDKEGGRDSWEVTADIINELLPREQYKDDDAGYYYYHIHFIWEAAEQYLKSTYSKDHPIFGVKE